MYIEIAAISSKGSNCGAERGTLGVNEGEGPGLNAAFGRHPLSGPISLNHRSNQNCLYRALQAVEYLWDLEGEREGTSKEQEFEEGVHNTPQ
jgi:hypothetical protein